MNERQWRNLSASERDAIRDLADLSPQLLGCEGWRVQVTRGDGRKDRFIVGVSTGWKPAHVELRNRRSISGMLADKTFAEVRKIERVHERETPKGVNPPSPALCVACKRPMRREGNVWECDPCWHAGNYPSAVGAYERRADGTSQRISWKLED